MTAGGLALCPGAARDCHRRLLDDHKPFATREAFDAALKAERIDAP
jgi:hypothetical protein